MTHKFGNYEIVWLNETAYCVWEITEKKTYICETLYYRTAKRIVEALQAQEKASVKDGC